MARDSARRVVLGSLLLWGCPGDDSDGDDGSSPGSGATSTTQGPSSASNEDGPSPVTCEQLGGTCSCAGSCGTGQLVEPAGTCPQPPDEAGACSQECCVPVSGTSTSDSGPASSSGTDAGTTAADGGSSTSA